MKFRTFIDLNIKQYILRNSHSLTDLYFNPNVLAIHTYTSLPYMNVYKVFTFSLALMSRNCIPLHALSIN